MRTVLACLLLFCPACGDDAATGDATPTDADVASFAASYQLLSVGDPVPGGPPQGSFQDALDGWTYVFTGDADPQYLCQHDDPQTAEKLAEGNLPDAFECAAFSGPGPGIGGGLAGGFAPPPGFSDWQGVAEGGGCGAWSTMMCNRVLGITDPATPPTQAEYDEVAAGIAQASNGGSRSIDITAYYRKKGYCIGYESFGGSAVDYAFVSANKAAGCDVKVFVSRREEKGENGKERYSNTHIETVVEVGADSFTTNSWGEAGVIKGGSKGGFSHSLDGAKYTDNQGRAQKWPPGSTEVFLISVCPCDNPAFLVLGGKVLAGG